MTRPTYATARTASVTAALAAFHARFGVVPVAVVVNVGAVEQVEAALDVQAAAQSLRPSPVQVAEVRQLGLALEVEAER